MPVLKQQELFGLVSFTDLMSLNFSQSGWGEQGLAEIIDHQFSIDDIMSTQLTTLNTG